MARIDRPTKSGGNRQYQQEVAAGYIDILDAEVDGDIDTVYGLVNGNIDNYNISATAAIAYSKLSLTGQITNSDISGTAKISTGKIDFAGTGGVNTVPGATIQDGSLILNTKGLAGTSIQAQTIVGAPSRTFFAADMNVEKFLVETTWTTRGSHWFVFAWIAGLVGIPITGAGNTFRLVLRRNSTPSGVDGVLIGSFANAPTTASGSSVLLIPFTTQLFAHGASLPAGVNRMGLSTTLEGSAGIVANPQIAGGQLFVLEVA